MQQWDKNICNETSGFLFSHKCDRFPVATCEKCQRPICNDHTHDEEGEIICTTCMKALKKPHRPQGSRRRGRFGDPYYYDDPYFYGARFGWHRGFGGHRHGHRHHDHDPHDFTEADGMSFEHPGDDEFEQDMTES